MPDAKTYTGGCHCGMVRFECTTDLAMVTACNCSICTKKGLHFTFLDPARFRLDAGEDSLKEYLFNKHAIPTRCAPTAAPRCLRAAKNLTAARCWRSTSAASTASSLRS